jgi:hypothetical protein
MTAVGPPPWATRILPDAGMDKLKAFESFVSVATRGSLTAAAKAEGVAPAIMGRGWMRWKSTWA